eukprot:2425236-Rhodomonas_salina.3
MPDADTWCDAAVQCTSLHPRLALLTGTLARAADDLWSVLTLHVLDVSCGVGVWACGHGADARRTGTRRS